MIVTKIKGNIESDGRVEVSFPYQRKETVMDEKYSRPFLAPKGVGSAQAKYILANGKVVS